MHEIFSKLSYVYDFICQSDKVKIVSEEDLYRNSRCENVYLIDELFFWSDIYSSYKKPSLERWALSQLHCYNGLKYISEKIMESNKKFLAAQVNSIWIDGTPQAIGSFQGGTVKCELADLLYIVQRYNSDGKLLNRKGVLIQAKNTNDPKLIYSGKSTRKERDLLQRLDRSKDLKIVSGFSEASEPIGNYRLDSSVGKGLYDCARYLLMPKNRYWKKTDTNSSPFQVTWPKDEKTNKMKDGISLTKAMVDMVGNSSIGRDIVDPKNCEWSRLVVDLENKYRGVIMKGYGNQPRYSTYPAVSRGEVESQQYKFLDGLSSDLHNLKPYISIIQVNVVSPD